MHAQFRTGVITLAVFTLLTGLIYPVAVTGIAQWIFPHQANGSLVIRDNQLIGSHLIGQSFTAPKYFWSRPSATAAYPYNAAASSGSNLGPTNPALEQAVQARVNDLQAADPENRFPIPVDLVTSSASGLDPHISVAAAYYQVPRVARARTLSEEQVRRLVAQYTQGRQLGFLGEPRVNVLTLNMALDGLQ
jgi:K+-transporting ATPase ATPase C chain